MPKSSTGHFYILTANDYFSKWAQEIPLREVKKENVVDFIRMHIIYRYGIPRYIITDSGKPFFNNLVTSLCEKLAFYVQCFCKQHGGSLQQSTLQLTQKICCKV